MTQITEDYCSFETAKLLKEKGFEGQCLSKYDSNGCIWDNIRYDGILLGNNDIFPQECLAPTLQMAMKWLREVHKLHIWIAHKLKQNKGLPWYYEIHNIETGTVVKIGDVVCGSYEVACEIAIKYCLENLI